METNSGATRVVTKIFLLGFFFLAFAAPAGAKSDPTAVGRLQPDEGQGSAGKFALGALRRKVVAIAGLPNERIGDQLWIYYECGLKHDEPTAKGCDALVVIFKNDRVAAMKLTNVAALRTSLAQQKLKPTGPSYADLLR
jgi:hypothetical protein